MENNDCYNYGKCDNGMKISYKTYICRLPYEIYSSANSVNWIEIIDGEYCSSG